MEGGVVLQKEDEDGVWWTWLKREGENDLHQKGSTIAVIFRGC
jgi:hypothetical protein